MTVMTSNMWLSRLACTFVNQLRAGVLAEILTDGFPLHVLRSAANVAKESDCDVIGTDDEYDNEASAMSFISKQQSENQSFLKSLRIS
jgi:hypothetical protein